MTDALIGTRNFTPLELDRVSSGGRVPDALRANGQRLLDLMQRFRDVLEVPIVLTSGYRSVQDNARLSGASATSDHLQALGADWVVPSLSKIEVAVLLDEYNGELTPYSQLIYYLTDDHFHAAVGSKGERLVKVDATSYRVYRGADTLSESVSVKQTPAAPAPVPAPSTPGVGVDNGQLVLLVIGCALAAAVVLLLTRSRRIS